jgi:uncharacterized protein YjbJ (UPF0337 family)
MWKRYFGPLRSESMNRELIEGKVRELRGRARIAWGRLVNDEIAVLKGKRDELTGRRQQAAARSRWVDPVELYDEQDRRAFRDGGRSDDFLGVA